MKHFRVCVIDDGGRSDGAFMQYASQERAEADALRGGLEILNDACGTDGISRGVRVLLEDQQGVIVKDLELALTISTRN